MRKTPAGTSGLWMLWVALATWGCTAVGTEHAVVLIPSTPVLDETGGTITTLPAGATVEFLGEFSAGLQVRLDDGRTGYIERHRAVGGAWPAAVIATLKVEPGGILTPPAAVAVVAEEDDAVELAYALNEKIHYGRTNELSHLSAVGRDLYLTQAWLEIRMLKDPEKSVALKKLLEEAGDSELVPHLSREAAGESPIIEYKFPEPFLADDDSL
jgi:hypothetical protein